MKRFDCIIFDFDGTLADTAAGILATVKETFRRLGFQGADDGRILPTIGLVLEQSLQQIGDLTEAQTRDAARLYREIFPEFGEVNSRLFPGVTETLDELHARGYRMAIATSRGRESLEAIMAPYGVNGYFEEMVTATDRLAPKPAPDMVLTLLARMGQPAEGALVVGDTVYYGLRPADGLRCRLPHLRCDLRKPKGDAAAHRVSRPSYRQFRRTSENRLRSCFENGY